MTLEGYETCSQERAQVSIPKEALVTQAMLGSALCRPYRKLCGMRGLWGTAPGRFAPIKHVERWPRRWRVLQQTRLFLGAHWALYPVVMCIMNLDLKRGL